MADPATIASLTAIGIRVAVREVWPHLVPLIREAVERGDADAIHQEHERDDMIARAIRDYEKKMREDEGAQLDSVTRVDRGIAGGKLRERE